MTTRLERARPLFDLILAHEAGPAAQRAQGVDNPYDVVWSRIKPKDRPRSPITKLTVERVLWWQDVIDPIYMSEAAGGFQILEDTLRTLRFHPKALFDKATQEDLGLQLLDRRGWAKCEADAISPEAFGNNLAREWASLPVITGPKRGRSYYAGDGLNKAGADPDEVLEAIRAALVDHDAIPVSELELAYVTNLVEWANHAPPKAAPEKELRAWRGVMPEKEAA